MLKARLVTNDDELLQIHQLGQNNHKKNLDQQTQKEEGFVTWLYSFELLKKMHQLSPSVVVGDGEEIVAYALTTLKASRSFHPDLENMFHNLELVQYKNTPLSSFEFYCMGQICIAKEFRGKGLVNTLYQKHKEVYGTQYDFILTEISTSNYRSIRAHEKIGFQTIYNYRDEMDEWNVVIWNWK